MKTFKLRVLVELKEGILDPQAEAIQAALNKLEYSTVSAVECDKVFVISLKAEDSASALEIGRKMARDLLANVVMENFEVDVVT